MDEFCDDVMKSSFGTKLDESFDKLENKIVERFETIELHYPYELGVSQKKRQAVCIFGKRLKNYFGCLAAEKNNCIISTGKRKFRIEDVFGWDGAACQLLKERNGFIGTFNTTRFAHKTNGKGETVVFEEKANEVKLFFSVDDSPEPSVIGFSVSNEFDCLDGFPCKAGNPRVVYTTLLSISDYDTDSAINGLIAQ